MGKKSAQKKTRSAQKPTKVVSKGQVAAPVERPSILSGSIPVAKKPAYQANAKISLMDHMEYVRSDIVRISFLLLVIVLLLVILFLVNDKTTLLHTAGKHISTFLRLQNS